MTWILIDDLETDRQYQFWVTAVTSSGEGMRSDIVLETSSNRGKSVYEVPWEIFKVRSQQDFNQDTQVAFEFLAKMRY